MPGNTYLPSWLPDLLSCWVRNKNLSLWVRHYSVFFRLLVRYRGVGIRALGPR